MTSHVQCYQQLNVSIKLVFKIVKPYPRTRSFRLKRYISRIEIGRLFLRGFHSTNRQNVTLTRSRPNDSTRPKQMIIERAGFCIRRSGQNNNVRSCTRDTAVGITVRGSIIHFSAVLKGDENITIIYPEAWGLNRYLFLAFTTTFIVIRARPRAHAQVLL